MDKHITVQHSLNERELKIITDNMHKGDYTHMGRSRYIDLDDLIKQVEADKIQNPGKQLKTVQLTRQLESYPPHNFYNITFE